MNEYFGIHIVGDPRIFSGRPIIGRHRITVHDLAALHRNGETADEIAEAYQLTPTEVEAGLAYYRDHREEIDRELVEDEIEIARLAAADDSPLRQRLREARSDPG
jgi:uncharacterized protein (DUF433 family)